MVTFTLIDGAAILLKREDVIMVKCHGDKTLVYTKIRDEPFCISNSFSEVRFLMLKDEKTSF
ncbi:hypothetical protein SB6424_05442 [Klebsiella pasteurii]|nr:hypothetical protein SB6416_05427 [Klebsiella pasteurii]VUS87481.1 hypothetical protein SB6424_05442 [Klebsiella pasteurii]